MDRAAFAYIKRMQAERGLTRPELAKRAGIPYQTLRGWWDAAEVPALSITDLAALLRALDVPGAKAYKEIERLAVTMQDGAE